MDVLTNPERIRGLSGGGRDTAGPVLYWMHRNFRASDNWALIHAREEALRRRVPVAVAFCLAPAFLGATLRQYAFLLDGLRQTAGLLRTAAIPLVLRSGDPAEEMIRLCTEVRPSLVVTDFDPLRLKRSWLERFREQGGCPLCEVESRNIVPAWIASDHREFMARTFRPRIHRHLDAFLDPFPELPPHPFGWTDPPASLDFERLRGGLKVDERVQPVDWCLPGETAARAALDAFLTQRLDRYGQRNDPNAEANSGLSPYLHFGMLASQTIVLEIRRRGLAGEQVEAFLEELVVRRELSDNYCLYTPDYDRISGFPEWARRTLDKHRRDVRAYVYTEDEFDQARTHDPIWNAAQHQLVRTGVIHGYLRMYWAKKILEWTSDPAEALRIAIWLNDRYGLDGRDTNGYTGIAWSIGGVHDRGWTERPIFGTIRFMNAAGCRRKFDADRYIRTWTPGQPRLFPAPPTP